MDALLAKVLRSIRYRCTEESEEEKCHCNALFRSKATSTSATLGGTQHVTDECLVEDGSSGVTHCIG
jgi:hypothetical protein